MDVRADAHGIALHALVGGIPGDHLAAGQAIGHSNHAQHLVRAGPEHHVIRRQSFLPGDHLSEFAVRAARIPAPFVESVLHGLPR